MRDFGERRRLFAAAACLATCEKERIACFAAAFLLSASAASIPGRGVEPCCETANVASYSSSVNRVSPLSSIVVVVILCWFVRLLSLLDCCH